MYSALTSDKKEKRFEAIAHLFPGNRTPVNERPLSLNQSLFDQFYETLPTPPGEIDYRSYLGFLLILKKKEKKKIKNEEPDTFPQASPTFTRGKSYWIPRIGESTFRKDTGAVSFGFLLEILLETRSEFDCFTLPRNCHASPLCNLLTEAN